jgi:hypothetical protein
MEVHMAMPSQPDWAVGLRNGVRIERNALDPVKSLV